ncbi:6698_t:CDS:2 [Ambispora gerdemannii]|uniref:Microtubule-associated protein n=1 Tax=Ambispora gerdemannii TaxID=144530 RepID=A0A9N8ZDF2_9GLOM|nr:6698_t:CDS:2 [Ambispora gerdemannii]
MNTTNEIMKENNNTEVNSVKSPRTPTSAVKPRIPFSGAVKLSSLNTPKTTPGVKHSIGATKTSTQSTKSSSSNKVSPIAPQLTPNISNPLVLPAAPRVSPVKSLANKSSSKKTITTKSPSKTHRSTKSMPPRINTSNVSNNNPSPLSIRKRRSSQPELTQNPTSLFKSPIDLSHVKSRVGSLDNISYTPKSASNSEKKKVFSEKLDYSKVRSRVGSFDNIKYMPKRGDTSGDVKIVSKKPEFTSVQSKVGSRENISYVPKKGNTQVFTSKLDLKNVKSRVGSLDNIKHVPGGGDVVIYNEKLKFRKKAAPKVDAGTSQNNVDNIPFLEDDRLNSALSPSPISSLSLDDAPEYNSPTEELMTPTPFRVALSPIAEILQSSQEEDEMEYQQSIAQLISPSVAPQTSPDIANKTAIIKGKPAPISEEKSDKPVESITTVEEEPPSPSPITNRETPQSIKAKIAALEAKNAEVAARKLAAKEKLKAASLAIKVKVVDDDEEKLKAASFATKVEKVDDDKDEERFRDFIQKFQQEFGINQAEELDEGQYDELDTTQFEVEVEDEEDDDSECPQDDADIIYAVNNEDDSDLSFEVNVLRKSRLLSDSSIREVESLYIPEIPPLAIQIPPESNSNPVVPELTIAQKRAYDSSWI